MRSRQHGFTLVETAAATLVLVTSALGLTATLAQGGILADGTRERQRAVDALDAVVARMRATPFSQLTTRFHARGFEVDGLRAGPDDPDGLPGEVSFDYGPGGNRDFYAVTVRVRWSGRQGVRTVETVRYLANVHGDTGVPVAIEDVTGGEAIAYVVGTIDGGDDEEDG